MKLTSKKMTDAAISKSETAIRKSFNAMDSAAFTTEIAIHYDGPSPKLISNVDVEFLVGKPSSILINIKNDIDSVIYRDKGLSEQYSVKEARLEYNESKDYQYTFKELIVKPIMTKTYFTIRLRKQN